MNRFAVFVDAGYLYGAGGDLVHHTTDRPKLFLNFEETVSGLVDLAREHSGIGYLRTYWYDGATNASPTPSHMVIASIPGVKLRLGQLTLGKQKGVDSRIVRDLIVLARDRAISAAYVLSGDEDIREGVAEAQDQGLSVVLLGIEPPPGQHNQARSLLNEADAVIQLTRDQVSQWMGLREAPPRLMGDIPSWPTTSSGNDVEQIGKDFGRSWAEDYRERVPEALSSKPRIPLDVDTALLRNASGKKGELLTEVERHALRAGFWAAIDEVSQL